MILFVAYSIFEDHGTYYFLEAFAMFFACYSMAIDAQPVDAWLATHASNLLLGMSINTAFSSCFTYTVVRAHMENVIL